MKVSHHVRNLIFLLVVTAISGSLLWHDFQTSVMPPVPKSARQQLASKTGDTQADPVSGNPNAHTNPKTVASPSVALLPQSKVRARILMYHYIRAGVDPAVDKLGYNLSIAPDQLDAQLTFLENKSYKPLSMADAASGKGTSHSVVLTFDDGYEDFYTNAYPLLVEHGWTATAYIITGKVGTSGYMTWDQIKELQNHGFEIGAHTVTHRDLAILPIAQQQAEIIQSKLTLEKELGATVTAFAYPSGEYNPDTLVIVRQAGFTSAVTTHTGIATPYNGAFELPRIRISPAVTLPLLAKELK